MRPGAIEAAVGEGGLEPPRSCDHRNLNPARLPIPPLARTDPDRTRRPATSDSRVAVWVTRRNLSRMRIARGLERRLEKLFEQAPGRVFPGRLHPSELAGRIFREADLAMYQHATGPATANRYVLAVSPGHVGGDTAELERSLETAFEEFAAETGIRLEGAPSVAVAANEDIDDGQIACEATVARGPLPPWARLVSNWGSHQIGHNRALIGRSTATDVVIDIDEVSRRHALIWRERGGIYLRDLQSSNGTTLDGSPIGTEPYRLAEGSGVALGGHRFRLTVG